MRKLLKLKGWFTLSETAKHLTSTLGEEVSESDILQLALQHKLKLSVMFPDGVRGITCLRLKEEEITYEEVPSLDGKGTVLLARPTVAFYGPMGEAYTADGKVSWLDSDTPFELTMMGGEQSTVEARYWTLATGKIHEPGNGVWGTFVRQGSQYFKLMDRLNPNRPPSYAPEDYYGIGNLSDDAILVVETKNLLSFEQSIEDIETSPEMGEKPLLTRERNSYLNIIGALLELIQSPRPGRERGQSAIIGELLQNYSEKEGISTSNLEKRFAEANRSLKGL
jgi:hypothetical protein